MMKLITIKNRWRKQMINGSKDLNRLSKVWLIILKLVENQFKR